MIDYHITNKFLTNITSIYANKSFELKNEMFGQ